MSRIISAGNEGSVNPNLLIKVVDEPGPGGANHLYSVQYDAIRGDGESVESQEIFFQKGPVHEVGVNGLTNEALLAIVLDRLKSFQSGPYVCEENHDAKLLIELGLQRLHDRTKERESRGVEGSHQL